MDFFEFVEKVNQLDLFDLLDEIIRENESEILNIYQNTQLQQGKDETGGKIGYYRSDAYVAMKERLRPEWSGNLDLKLTGELYEKQRITIHENHYQIISDAEHFQEVIDKYNVAFLGWNEETITIISKDIIKPKLQEKIKDALGLV